LHACFLVFFFFFETNEMLSSAVKRPAILVFIRLAAAAAARAEFVPAVAAIVVVLPAHFQRRDFFFLLGTPHRQEWTAPPLPFHPSQNELFFWRIPHCVCVCLVVRQWLYAAAIFSEEKKLLSRTITSTLRMVMALGISQTIKRASK
jgi:hypothetical protein